MADFVVKSDMGVNAENCTINAIPAQNSAPAVKVPAQNSEIRSTGDPDLAPGQKRPEGAQKSIYGEIPHIPVLGLPHHQLPHLPFLLE